jgi:hypothetical protein
MELLIGVIVGFALGYGVRSGHVAASLPAGTPRKKRIMKFQKVGATVGQRQPLVSCRQLSGEGGMGS